MSLFFVDSGSDLTKEQIKKLGIECLSFDYLMENELSEIEDETKAYSKIKKGLDIKVKQKTKKEYQEIFEPCLKQGDDVFYIASSLYVNDNLYKSKDVLVEKYPDRKFEIVENKNFSIGGGMVAYNLALEYRKGASVDELKEKADMFVNNYALYFAVDRLEGLKNCGLIGNNAINVNALNLKPMISVDLDGKLNVIDKISGKKRVITKLVEYIRQTGKNVADYPIGIMYSNNTVDADELKQKIHEYFGEEIVVICNKVGIENIGITGLGVLGISFHVHSK